MARGAASGLPASGGHDRHDRGQATVELALLLPVLAVLALALFQVALVARDQVLVVHVARDAARALSVGTDEGRVRAGVERRLPGARVVVHRGGGVGAAIVVAIDYPSVTALPIVGPLLPDPTLGARVEMRSER